MKVSVFVAAAVMTLAAAPVFAHGGPGCGQTLEAELPGLFAQADASGDGSLTLDEFKTFKQLVAEKRTELMFQKLDATATAR
jgi:hypothetical protein